MQAVIITAYHDEEQLLRLIRSFRGEALIFVHIDRKSDIKEETLKKEAPERLFVLKKYDIHWGSFAHLQAVLELLLNAAGRPEISYVHVISGQDMLVIPFPEFERRFAEEDRIFMSCSGMETFPEEIRSRYRDGTFSSDMEMRSVFTKLINRGYRLVHQKKDCIGEFTDIYKGMIWVSMPASAACYVCRYVKAHPEFLQALKHVVIPEEFFFQTILMNSSYRDKVVRDNLRYTDWNMRNGSIPAILDESDYDRLTKGKAVFARKIDSRISGGLIERLERYRDGKAW